jgi:hypothetical protein
MALTSSTLSEEPVTTDVQFMQLKAQPIGEGAMVGQDSAAVADLATESL